MIFSPEELFGSLLHNRGCFYSIYEFCLHELENTKPYFHIYFSQKKPKKKTTQITGDRRFYD